MFELKWRHDYIDEQVRLLVVTIPDSWTKRAFSGRSSTRADSRVQGGGRLFRCKQRSRSLRGSLYSSSVTGGDALLVFKAASRIRELQCAKGYRRRLRRRFREA